MSSDDDDEVQIIGASSVTVTQRKVHDMTARALQAVVDRATADVGVAHATYAIPAKYDALKSVVTAGALLVVATVAATHLVGWPLAVVLAGVAAAFGGPMIAKEIAKRGAKTAIEAIGRHP